MITRRTFIRSSALVAATLVLGGATGGLAGCASGADVLRVGTKIDVPGFGFQNPETGNIEGMEVDIARELAKRIKGSPDALKVTGVNVTTRGAMLDNGTLDATLATFTITEARKKSYNFSRPYYIDHIGVLVKKSSGIVDLKDLDGKTVGVALSATTRDKLTAAVIARQLHIQPTYLHRLFREHTAKTMNEHLQSIRIQQAKLLLTGTRRSLLEIAMDVGISSQQHFSRLFRKITGLSPQEYRKTHPPGAAAE